MKICIAGWYFRPMFFESVKTSGYEAFVIKHREGDTRGIPSKLYPNLGLEFGAYRQYVENHWDGESDVLFIHDDTEVIDCVAFHDIATLGNMGVEQAYIFRDENDEFINGGAHGRAVWMQAGIIRMLKPDFPADMTNTGTNVGVIAQAGIFKFHHKLMECGKNTVVIAIVPQFQFGHRGKIHDRMFVYRRHGSTIPGGKVHVAE